ncbi:hypothetical protein NDU88_003291 [Pleurodeles waltl]|uniref:Reverse transcriptase/retrotransposon-derived protein RNase H-like domain-containing protein n=1 Tax=Pleurodeles waltl TaxID=8319 RepID=A0AAV7T5S2_PLEWA|nr:hypothetical protein NDU88_003291 [Pleurodeles waltl]
MWGQGPVTSFQAVPHPYTPKPEKTPGPRVRSAQKGSAERLVAQKLNRSRRDRLGASERDAAARHTVSGDGIKPKLELAKSIMPVPTPVDKDQVRSFLGLAEYHSKFVKNFVSVVQPLRMILKKGVKFEWSLECEGAFNAVKDDIGKMPTLGRFDVKRKTFLSTDGSL